MSTLTYAQAKADLLGKFTAWTVMPVNLLNTVTNTGYDDANSHSITVAIRTQLITWWNAKQKEGYTFSNNYSASLPATHDFKSRCGTYRFNWHIRVNIERISGTLTWR